MWSTCAWTSTSDAHERAAAMRYATARTVGVLTQRTDFRS
jgi:hypothetical protein